MAPHTIAGSHPRRDVSPRRDRPRPTWRSIAPFNYGTPEQRATWQALVTTLEGMLRLHQHTPGTLVALAEYLYQRTNGMIGSLSQLVRGAAILASGSGGPIHSL